MRQEPEFFKEREMQLVFIAKKLKEAVQLEDVLNAAGLDYAVETDNYTGGVVFRTERVGAFFYVLPEDGDRAREALRGAGFAAALE